MSKCSDQRLTAQRAAFKDCSLIQEWHYFVLIFFFFSEALYALLREMEKEVWLVLKHKLTGGEDEGISRTN